MNVLAIDQGTSATKAIVVGEGGRVLGEGSAPVNPVAGPGGAVEQDPHELLDSIVTAGRAALDAAGEHIARAVVHPLRALGALVEALLLALGELLDALSVDTAVGGGSHGASLGGRRWRIGPKGPRRARRCGQGGARRAGV